MHTEREAIWAVLGLLLIEYLWRARESWLGGRDLAECQAIEQATFDRDFWELIECNC